MKKPAMSMEAWRQPIRLPGICERPIAEADEGWFYHKERAGAVIEQIRQDLSLLPKQELHSGALLDALSKIANESECPSMVIEYYFSLLHPFGYRSGVHQGQTKVKVRALDGVGGNLRMIYLLAKALERSGAFGREEALCVWMDLVDWVTKTSPPRSIPPGLSFFTDAFDSSYVDFEDGRNGLKIERCRWHESVKSLNDPDFFYAIACHYDFEAAKKRPNCVLTRKSTLMAGGPYCDFVWHNTAVNRSLGHPPAKFWENLGQPRSGLMGILSRVFKKY